MKIRLATPVESRESLRMAVTMANNNVRFVCIPAQSDADYDELIEMSLRRLDSMIVRAEAEEGAA